MGRMPPGPREGNEAPTSAWGAGTQGHYGGVRREPQHCLEPVPCRELPGCGRLARATFMGLGLRCHLGLGRKQLPGRPRRRPPCPPRAFLWGRLPRSSEPGALGSYRWPRGQEPHRGGQPPSPQAAWLCLQPTESGKAWRKMPDTQRHRLNRACGRVAAVQGPERGQGGSSAVTGGPAPGPWGGDREGALCSSGTRASRL